MSQRAPDIDFATLPEALDRIWALLGRGVADRRHGFHHPVIANVSEAGLPQSRVVVLRAADRQTASLRFHTDRRAAKCADLAARPAVSLTLYDEADRAQLRLDGVASLHAGDAIAALAWDSSQRMSRSCYATLPAPGSILAERDAFALPATDDAIAAGRENFVAVVIRLKRIEWLYLRAGGHRRAVFDLETGAADWLAP
jgi:pyridoxamine 5'-phosphate oxidase